MISANVEKVASSETACVICGAALAWEHDHRSDNSGLDDGPPLPARKKMERKPPDEYRVIRARAWATRREKYGPHGHR
jgi:hypothetical protein